MYGQGQGVPQDYTEAVVWWRKAAEQGNALAQAHLGVAYDFGHGVQQDHTQAALWFRKAAEQGNSHAQFQLGLSYELGHGVPQDYAEAYFWLDLAAAGEVVADMQKDFDKTRDNAASYLAPADLSRLQERARKWSEDHSAHTQGAPASVTPISATVELSAPSSRAQTSESSESTLSAQRTARLKEQAASGDPEAQYELGEAYHVGKGVQQDDAQAAQWDLKSAEQGNVSAEFRLGSLYGNGLGVPLDKAQAAFWFRKAAEQGNVYAQEQVGLDYQTGEGVQRDYAEAYFWLYIACAGNAREVVAGERATERDAAAVYLRPAERSRVQERARKWLADHSAKPQ